MSAEAHPLGEGRIAYEGEKVETKREDRPAGDPLATITKFLPWRPCNFPEATVPLRQESVARGTARELAKYSQSADAGQSASKSCE
jgi:hypothetical protein